jgi:hypothetical protein
MKRFIEGEDRNQSMLFPECLVSVEPAIRCHLANDKRWRARYYSNHRQCDDRYLLNGCLAPKLGCL